jgi:hypothetical protein
MKIKISKDAFGIHGSRLDLKEPIVVRNCIPAISPRPKFKLTQCSITIPRNMDLVDYDGDVEILECVIRERDDEYVDERSELEKTIEASGWD